MSDSTLREKATSLPTDTPVDTAPQDTTSTVDTKVPELLATYAEDQGKPYVAQYLELDNIWDQDRTLKYEIEVIEGYVRDQISKGIIDNNVKAGEKFLKELEKSAHISPYESTTNRINKLLAYIDFKKVVDG